MQAMVDEAAKKAGYTIKSYHGTLAKDFTEFKKSFIGSRFNYDDKGFFFIDRKSIAEDYASSAFDSSKKGRVLDVYLRVKKPLLVDKQFCLREGLGNPFRDDDAIGVWDAYLEFFKEEAEARRADGIILDDGMSKMTVVFDGEQIKSADPITYDDAGKVIPLSKRFSPYNRDIRFALPETVEQEVLEKYGRTFSWSTTGYIFKNGTKLDLSGKSVGAPGGYRALDHRDIFDIYEVDSYTDAMIEFMARGNIRVAPESPGINLIVEPTEAQYEQITSLVERLGWKEKEFHVDFDNENGSTIGSLDYDGNVSARKVIADIKYFFKEGKIPYQSDLTQFRYALTENAESIEKYTEKQYNSFGWARYAEALSKNELDDLYSKIQARTTLRTFKQSSKGEAIIEVNKKPHTTLDVDNVFVFVKGKKNDFTISRVVRFNAETETEMDLIKEDLYEGRTWSDTYYSFYRQEGFAKEYRRENTESFEQYNQEVRRRSLGQTSRGTNQDNRQSGKYRSGYSLTVGENGEVVERFALTGDEDLDAIFGDIDMNEDADGYSYDALTKKPDLSVVELPAEIPQTADGKVDKKAILARGKLNARKQKNPNNTDTNTYVRVNDIGLDVLLGTKGLQHGLARSEETALAVMKIGDILRGSVAVNELNGNASRKTDMSYVLLGACHDSDSLYVVRSVVSKLQNDVTEIDVYQLSAIKGKKTETPNSALKRGAAVTEQSSLISSESPVISIADFLQAVKDIPLINEIFSEDVAKKTGAERSKGSLYGDIRYALSDSQTESGLSRGQRAKFVANNTHYPKTTRCNNPCRRAR